MEKGNTSGKVLHLPVKYILSHILDRLLGEMIAVFLLFNLQIVMNKIKIKNKMIIAVINLKLMNVLFKLDFLDFQL